MSDIYGRLTERPEYSITDSRRFLVEIRLHEWEAPKRRRDAAGQLVVDPFCDRCGFSREAIVHQFDRR